MKKIFQTKKVKQTIAATTILLASVFSGQVSAYGQGFSSYDSYVETRFTPRLQPICQWQYDYRWAYDSYGNMVEKLVKVRVCY